MRRAIPVVLLVLAAAAALAPAQEAGPRGHLLLIGGGDKPRPVMERFVALAGGPSARILVFPTASSERLTSRDYLALFTRDLDCTDVRAVKLRHRDEADDPEVAAMVERAGGIFFTGGDQRRITALLLGTRVGEAVRAAHTRGAVVGGTSAGTACMSPLMMTGEGAFDRLTAGTVELAPGLGLLPGVLLDQHFVARSRLNRLVAAVLEHPDLLGVGVDEATAVDVRPDRTFEVLGEGWVVVLDARRAAIRRQPRPAGAESLGGHGLVTHVLLPGEVFDLERREVAPGPGPG